MRPLDVNRIKARINNKEYKIKFSFKNGIKFFRGTRINHYKLVFPINDIEKFDIQNKVELIYDNYDTGKILYSVLQRQNAFWCFQELNERIEYH